ncbi:carboxylesterase family protein [uncultured Polaribacter sp.]|uniref:alpha/beta hydrolase n=1 Tax=uncultured Polaribacter sp. TaxID=174711 RepID=UPI002621178E|nr:carboxylesterase family protein [uncultured Polaribacter sp.]
MKNYLLIFICLFFLQLSSQEKKTYTYAVKEGINLKMDVYTPDNISKDKKVPVLLWMHGGGFAGGKRDNGAEVKMMQHFTTKGYVSISISYRLLRKGKKTGFGCNCPKEDKMETFKQAALDYLDATKFVVDNSEMLQIDSSKIIAGGSSAGAEGVLNAVFLRSFFVADITTYKNVKYAGVFSLAGAVVNANYITKKNAIPSVLFHGTDDNLVPFATAPHHYCKEDKPGYMVLDGSETIIQKLDNIGASYYFHKVIGGRHELSSIPFKELENVVLFFDKTILNSEVIQTKKIVTKKNKN